MNCRRIEKLIPLYVEGDLDCQRADAVGSHAQSCEGCAGLIAEYEESQRWLRSFAPPHFDEAEFYDLKRGVLKQINSRETRASFLHRLAENWTRRVAFATLAALVAISGALALYVYRQSVNQDTRQDNSLAQDKDQREKQLSKIPLELKPPVQQRNDLNPAPRAPFIHRRPRHATTARQMLALAKRVKRRQFVRRHDNPGAESHVARETKDAISPDPASAQEMLRIEIQTSDPSIRIIWFSPKESDSNRPGPITETE
jgi:Putative zinc-finger